MIDWLNEVVAFLHITHLYSESDIATMKQENMSFFLENHVVIDTFSIVEMGIQKLGLISTVKHQNRWEIGRRQP